MAVIEKGDRFVTREGLPIYVTELAILGAKKYFSMLGKEPYSLVQLFAESSPIDSAATDLIVPGYKPFWHPDTPDHVLFAKIEGNRWVVSTFDWITKQSKAKHLAKFNAKPKRAVSPDEAIEGLPEVFKPLDGLTRDELVEVKKVGSAWLRNNPESDGRQTVVDKLIEVDAKLSTMKGPKPETRETLLLVQIQKLESRLASAEARIAQLEML